MVTTGSLIYSVCDSNGNFQEKSFLPIPSKLIAADENGLLTSTDSGGNSGTITSVNGQTGPSISLAISDIPGLASDLAGRETSGTAALLISNLHLGTASTQASSSLVLESDSRLTDSRTPSTSIASQSEMEAGTESGLRMVSPLRVAQAIAALAPAGGGAGTITSVAGQTGPTVTLAYGDISGLGTMATSARTEFVLLGSLDSTISGKESAGTAAALISNLHLGSSATSASTAYELAGAAAAAIAGLGTAATQASSAFQIAGSLDSTIAGKADKATTLAGYGITDGGSVSTIDWGNVTGKPTLGAASTQANSAFVLAGSLGTASTAPSSQFATSAQGSLADSAVQPAQIGTAATQPTSAYILTGSLGTASTAPSSQFATAAQGSLAASAIQPANVGTIATAARADYILTGSLGSASTAASTQFATAIQGTKADNALAQNIANAALSAIASVYANAGIYFDSATSASSFSLTSQGRALLGDSTQADQRTRLGLGSSATQASSAFESAGAAASAISALNLGTISTAARTDYVMAGSLGTASTAPSSQFATAAQGALAASAVQPGAIGTSATQPTSAYILTGSLGTASTAPSTQFATAAQGALAASALQPANVGTIATSARADYVLSGSLGTASTAPSTQFATSAQGSLAASALQPAGSGASLTGITTVQIGGLGTAATQPSTAYALSASLGTASTAPSTQFAIASHTQAASTISDSTTAGRALLTAADVAAQKTALGLGTAATQASTAFELSLGNPTAGSLVLTSTTGGARSWVDKATVAGTLGTTQATTSGTYIDFTGIPAGVKMIQLMLAGVSTNGSSPMQVQIGAGSITSSGYTSYSGSYSTEGTSSSGFLLDALSQVAASIRYGIMTLTSMGGNQWMLSGAKIEHAGTYIAQSVAGVITLGGNLDRVRLTTVNGTDLFDLGSANILYFS